MRLHHEFPLPIPPEQAWDTLLDVSRVARCMPGAILDRADGDEFSGRVVVKVGPLRMAYRAISGFPRCPRRTQSAAAARPRRAGP